MKLNAAGVPVYGLAGLWVGDRRLSSNPVGAGTPGWVDARTVTANMRIGTAPEAWAPVLVDVETGNVQLLDTGAAHRVLAGDGVVAIWPGLRLYSGAGTLPMRRPDIAGANVFTVSPDGLVVIDRNFDGRDLEVIDLETGEVRATRATRDVYDVAGTGRAVQLRDGWLAWVDLDGSHLVRLEVPDTERLSVTRREPINWIVPLPLPDGRVALLERSNRLTLRINGSALGLVLEDARFQFGPDACVVGDEIVVAYSTTQGESRDRAVLLHIPIADFDLAEVDLNAPPAITVPTLPALPRALAFGMADACSTDYGYVDAPGNVDVFVRPVDLLKRPHPDRPFIGTREVVNSARGTDQAHLVRGVYLHVGADGTLGAGDTIENVRQTADDFGVPVYVYADSATVTDAQLACARRGWDVVLVQGYAQLGETTVEAFTTRVGMSLTLTTGHRRGLMAAFYTQSSVHSLQHVVNLHPVMARWVGPFKLEAVFGFAVLPVRRGGTAAHEELAQLAGQWAVRAGALPAQIPRPTLPGAPTNPTNPTPPAHPPPTHPTEGPMKQPMKNDEEYRAFVKDVIGPMLERVGVANGAAFAQGVGDTFRDVKRWGDKARDPRPVEYEFLARAYAKGQSPDQEPALSFVRDCLQ